MPFTDTIKPGGQTGAGVANLIVAIVAAATCLAAAAASATTPDNAEPAPPGDNAAFFTERVLPILRERCFECHSHDHEINGGLASGWQQGGQTGPAIVPGKPEESLLIAAVRHTKPDYEMPPDGDRLPAAEIATLVEWVGRGAADPRTTTAADAWEKLYAERLGWWSLQPVTRPPVPAVRDAAWPRTDIDRFILAGLEAKGLRPAAEAAPATLARRLALVLTGLPPEPAVAADFVADPSPAAFERLVESLLESPHYGELGRVAAVFATGGLPEGEAARPAVIERVAECVLAAVDRWAAGACDAADVQVINEAIRNRWLTATALDDPAVAEAVATYRAAEKRLVPDRTIGSMEEWPEGQDARIAIRGEATDLGDLVPRGTIRFLAAALEDQPRPAPPRSRAAGSNSPRASPTRGIPSPPASTSTASGSTSSARGLSARPTITGISASRLSMARCSITSRAGSSKRAGPRRNLSARSCGRRPGGRRAPPAPRTWPSIPTTGSGTTTRGGGSRRSRSATHCSPSPAGSTAPSVARRLIPTAQRKTRPSGW